jgi:hypothetical protein
VSPASLSFQDRPVGSTSGPRVLTVANGGPAALLVSGYAFAGANPADYAVASDTCRGASIAPGASCTVSVVFTPQALGTRTASLQILDNAADSPQSVALDGTSSSVGGINSPPASPRSILVFDVRDMVDAFGYDPGQAVTFQVVRHGTVVGVSHATANATGEVLINHPPNLPTDVTNCWEATPRTSARATSSAARRGRRSARRRRSSRSASRSLRRRPDRAPSRSRASPATCTRGVRCRSNAIQQRMVAHGLGDLFDANGRRDMRVGAAGGDGSFAYDAPGSVHWTATYTGLDAHDVSLMVASESRAIWLGRNPLVFTPSGNPLEATFYEYGRPSPRAPRARCRP